jgi:hypothetical protein
LSLPFYITHIPQFGNGFLEIDDCSFYLFYEIMVMEKKRHGNPVFLSVNLKVRFPIVLRGRSDGTKLRLLEARSLSLSRLCWETSTADRKSFTSGAEEKFSPSERGKSGGSFMSGSTSRFPHIPSLSKEREWVLDGG